MTRNLLAIGLAAGLAALFSAATAQAQSYPTRPVTIIVPYPAGGPTDQVARQIAPKLAAKLGQNFVVENVSGGGTNIAGQRVARSAPDGTTLFVHNLQISANVALYKSLPFDTEKDFLPIAMINSNPLVLVGRKTLEAKTLPELVAWMKKNPARIGHPGVGSTGHLATALLAQALGVEVTYIPYRGAAPMLQDTLGGHIDLFFATPAAGDRAVRLRRGQGVRHHLEGHLAAVPRRAELRRRPTVRSLRSTFWQIMLAPAGTPKPIVDALDGALQDALDDPEILKVWAVSGMAPYPKAQRTPRRHDRLSQKRDRPLGPGRARQQDRSAGELGLHMAEHTNTKLAVRGCNITLMRGGAGRPLLMLHGAGGAGSWLPYMADLAARHDVIVPEHPGFGASDTPDWLDTIPDLANFYLDFLDQLDLKNVDLVGFSLGGWIAAELAARNTSRLASLTLVAAAGIHVKGVAQVDSFLRNDEQRVRDFFHDPKRADEMLKHLARPELEDVNLKNRTTTAKLIWQPRGYDPHLHKWLHRIDVPTLLVWGDDDRLFPKDYAFAYQRLIPGSQGRDHSGVRPSAPGRAAAGLRRGA